MLRACVHVTCTAPHSIIASPDQRVCGHFSTRMGRFKPSNLFFLPFQSHFNPAHSLVSFFALPVLSVLTHTHPFLLYIIFVSSNLTSSIFHINHGDGPTYPSSSHRITAFETSPWSRRLNHLHSRQCCPHWVRCRPYCLSPVSSFTCTFLLNVFTCYLAGETAAGNPYLNPTRHNNYPHRLLTKRENGSLQRRFPLLEYLPHLHLCRLVHAVSANLVIYRSHLPPNDLSHITANRVRELRLLYLPLLSLNSILEKKK